VTAARIDASTDTADLIAAGESRTVEFKSTARWSVQGKVQDARLEQVIVKTVAGFMNTDGGTLLIGVADDGTVLGLDDDLRTLKRGDLDGYEQFLTQLFDSHLSGAALAFVHVGFSDVDGKVVCRIDVSPAPRPVFAKPVGGKEPTDFWVRANNTTRQLTGPEMVEYQAHRFR
jgi:predicted HTH transcriptional regulator